MNRELPDVETGFRKGRGTRDQIANIRWIMEKARKFQKSIYFRFIDYAKAFDCVDHNKLWKMKHSRLNNCRFISSSGETVAYNMSESRSEYVHHL